MIKWLTKKGLSEVCHFLRMMILVFSSVIFHGQNPAVKLNCSKDWIIGCALYRQYGKCGSIIRFGRIKHCRCCCQLGVIYLSIYLCICLTESIWLTLSSYRSIYLSDWIYLTESESICPCLCSDPPLYCLSRVFFPSGTTAGCGFPATLVGIYSPARVVYIQKNLNLLVFRSRCKKT